MPYKYKKQSKVKKNFPRPLLIALLIAGAGVIILAILELTHTTSIFFKSKLGSSTIPSTVNTDAETEETQDSDPPPPGSSDKTPDTPPPTTAPDDDKTPAPPANSAELVAPSGSFVSNHRPSLATASSMESVCTTTAGATCTITFTKGSVTKTLEAKKTDSKGTVIWTWDVKTAGFEAGSWKITASATLNGQTKSASDLQNLEVQP